MQSYSILGIDVGNATTISSKGIIFDSRVTTTEPLTNANKLKVGGKTIWLGEGEYDTVYRKVDKKNYLDLLFGSLALSTSTIRNKIVLGLPLSQFQQDKSSLINIILANNYKEVEINGIKKQLCIEDVEVYPEGVVTLQDDYEGILIDVGGLTTDCALVIIERGRKKIINPISIPAGTIKLYTDFINKLNRKFGLDLTVNDSERILRKGLLLDGKLVNINFALEVFKNFVETLVSKLQVAYSLRTNLVSLTGGGGKVIFNPVKAMVGEGVTLQKNYLNANADAYGELGVALWQ